MNTDVQINYADWSSVVVLFDHLVVQSINCGYERSEFYESL